MIDIYRKLSFSIHVEIIDVKLGQSILTFHIHIIFFFLSTNIFNGSFLFEQLTTGVLLSDDLRR